MILPILASAAIESKPPSFDSTKRLDNGILERVCTAIGGALAQPVPDPPSTLLYSDGYHLSQKGSDEAARLVAGALAGLLSGKVSAAGKAS